MTATTYLAGLLLGLGLIVPIGPQNVFVVGQGLAVGIPRAFWAVLAAGICDTLLIALGWFGVGQLLETVPSLRAGLLVAGALFLTYLGVQSLRARDSRLDTADGQKLDARAVIWRTVSVSLLNPHAILDTVGVIGAAVAAQPASSRTVFAIGAMSASWLWFMVLAVGAAQVRRYLTERGARWFDRFSGLVMLLFAVLLAVEFVRSLL